MGHELTDAILYEGPQAFGAKRLKSVKDLFDERAALFYTPTENIPPRWVGSGPLDVTLPIATPSAFEWRELIGHLYPRIWVDLLQRATGKIRWRPMKSPALVRVEIFDVRPPARDAVCGAKALIDALKVKTTGRPDALLLYYFGAIEDDSPRHIQLECVSLDAESTASAHTRIVVGPAHSDS